MKKAHLLSFSIIFSLIMPWSLVFAETKINTGSPQADMLKNQQPSIPRSVPQTTYQMRGEDVRALLLKRQREIEEQRVQQKAEDQKKYLEQTQKVQEQRAVMKEQNEVRSERAESRRIEEVKKEEAAPRQEIIQPIQQVVLPPVEAPAMKTGSEQEHEDRTLLNNRVKADEFTETQNIRVIIRYKESVTQEKQDEVAQHGGDVKEYLPSHNAVAVSVTPEKLETIAADTDIASVDIDREISLLATEVEENWGVTHIFANSAHAQNITGTGVKIGVFDTGVDYTHPELSKVYAGGYDFVNNDPDPMDDNGHGTHVAGIIASAQNGTGVIGVSPGIQLYALKVLDANGKGYASNLIAALEWASKNGIHITNHSYGTVFDPGITVEQAFENTHAAGMLHIAAAGNSGSCISQDDTVNYPARYVSVMAVGAVDRYDTRACFSSMGDRVEISAPGVLITSPTKGGGFGTLSGTSSAAPFISGVAALMYAKGVVDTTSNGKLNDDIRIRLTSTAQDLGAPGKDSVYGYGLVNAEAALGLDEKTVTPALFISMTPEKATYLLGKDSSVRVIVHITNELTAPVENIAHSAFSFLPTQSSFYGLVNGDYIASFPIEQFKAGTQTVSVVVTDNRGIIKTGSASFQIQENAQQTISMGVSSLEYTPFTQSNGATSLNISFGVEDALKQPVTNAIVVVAFGLDSGRTWRGVNATDAKGKTQFELGKAIPGCYVLTVKTILKEGYVWDQKTPQNKYCFVAPQEAPASDRPLTDEDRRLQALKDAMQRREVQLKAIFSEAQTFSFSTVPSLAQGLGVTRNQVTEKVGNDLARRIAGGVNNTIDDRVVSFIAYGTDTTRTLGAGERAGVVNSFREAFGRLPGSVEDWQEVIKIGNGRWPEERNVDREVDAMRRFERVYLRMPDRSNPSDDAAVMIIAYGLRIGERNVASEKRANDIFYAVFGHRPQSGSDWDMVRAIAYSGASR
ncbi:MAG TPA: S8 family serine peptidase [Patescibacteria group bacterium]|nr:S8 family serine peptidase [Patescibacteria group bacterium]